MVIYLRKRQNEDTLHNIDVFSLDDAVVLLCVLGKVTQADRDIGAIYWVFGDFVDCLPD